MNSSDDTLRIDRWLFYTRFYKTRTLAQAAVSGGHVRINGERATPGSRTKCGDIIDLLRQRIPFRVTVIDIPRRRGPPTEAGACYEEDAADLQKRMALQDGLRQDRQLMPKTSGRPDKHTRRKLRQRSRNAD